MTTSIPVTLDFKTASERCDRIRALYRELELEHHATAWTTEGDLLGFVSGVGILSKLVMTSEGRWIQDGDVEAELKDKLSECFWSLFVLSSRLGIEPSEAMTSFMDMLDFKLSA